MRRKTIIYTTYAVSILIITSFLSVQILERRIRLPYSIAKKTGEFTNILTNLLKGNEIEEALFKRIQILNELEKVDKPHNSLEFSDVEWDKEKWPNTYRIVALGDSSTEGVYVSNQYSWPKQLESIINNFDLTSNFEVLNMGKASLGTFEEVEIFKNIGLDYNPDMVILQYYAWDWLCPDLNTESRETWENYTKGEYTLPPQIEAKITKPNDARSIIYSIVHEEYVNRTNRETEWEKCLKGPLEELIDTTKEDNIKLVVITWDTDSMSFPEEIEKLTSLLSEHEIPFYDFSNYLNPEKLEEKDIIPMNAPYKCPSETRLLDCHLSALGYEIVAKRMLEAITEILSIPKTELNLNCPCEYIGKESGCSIRFMAKSENPEFNIELIPGYEQIFDGFGLCIPYTNIKINSHGFRDYEYPVEKADNTFRVVVIGDSLTFGQGVELNQTYSKVLEKLLNEMNDNKNYEVLNFGSPGYNIDEKVEFLRTKAIKFNPDLVIFQYLADDVVDWNEFREIENERLQEFAEQKGKTVNSLTSYEEREVHSKTYREYVINLVNERLDESLKRVESGFEELDSITQNYIDILLIGEDDHFGKSVIEKISKSYDWPFINLAEILSEYPKDKVEIHPKDSHPTAFAHTIIAEKIYIELLSSNLLPTH